MTKVTEVIGIKDWWFDTLRASPAAATLRETVMVVEGLRVSSKDITSTSLSPAPDSAKLKVLSVSSS